MKGFSKNKTALLLACISVLGNRTSAMNTSPKSVKKPQTVEDVTSPNKSNLTKLKIAGIIGGSILGAGLIYEVLGDTILNVPTILKCIKNKSSNDPKTSEKTKPFENEKNITDSQKLKEPNIENSKFLEFLGGNKKRSKLEFIDEDGTINIANLKKFLEEKPENKEMSNEEINTMLDKMLNILNSFGSKDPQFLEEYNKAVENINVEKKKAEIYSDKLRAFRKQNSERYYKHIQVKYVDGSKYYDNNFKWKFMQELINFFASQLTRLKNDKSQIGFYKASFTNNSVVKYQSGEYDWQMELTDEKNLNIQEWIYNHGKKTFEVTLTLCE